MSKKIITVLIVLICFFTFNSVNAESVSNFIDLQSYNNIYRLSEESDVSLPFIKVFNDKAIFDKGLNSSGLSIGTKAVEVDGKTEGLQVIISSDTVNINGSLEYGIIMASNVMISGTVEKDVLIIAESIFITESANIGGDVIAVAGTMELKGNIAGNFIANSSDLLMRGTVEKDFRVYSEKVDFSDADVTGAIYMETNSEIDISKSYPNAVVKKIPTNTITEEEKKAEVIDTVINTIIGVVMFTLLNLLIVIIRPNLFKDLANKFLNNTSFGIIVGVLGIVTIPIIFTILLVLSMFGIGIVAMPALIAYIALIVVIIALSKFITGSVIYEILKDKMKINGKVKSFGILMLIYTSLYLICYIPYIGYFLKMAIILLSSGIVITGLTRKNK